MSLFDDSTTLQGSKPPKHPKWGREYRHFQSKLAKYQNLHIIETTASISTKVYTRIKPPRIGGLKTPTINPRWLTVAILKNR